MIYYHLEKMTEEGLLLPDCEKNGKRPEKTVYSVTEKGKTKFLQMLGELQEFSFTLCSRRTVCSILLNILMQSR